MSLATVLYTLENEMKISRPTPTELVAEHATRVACRVPLVERELITLPEHLSSAPVFSGVRVTRSLVLYVMFCRSLFVLLFFFLMAIVLPVLLRFTDSDDPFGIFKLFVMKRLSDWIGGFTWIRYIGQVHYGGYLLLSFLNYALDYLKKIIFMQLSFFV